MSKDFRGAIGYIRVPVSSYIPNPLRCFKCQKFGHGKSACRGRETYATCGQVGHTSSDCTSEPKCPNCTGNHSAFSKSCPKWLFEKRVQQLKAERNITFIEARKIASTESEGRSAPGGRTAAAVVGSRAAAAGSRSGPTPPATRSVEVQTDLTWPKGQEVPSALPPSASFTPQHATQTTQTTTHKLSSNTTDGPQTSGKRQSSQSPPTASASNKNNFNQPRGRPPDKTQKKPRLTRPPKSDSEVPTSNMFNPLYTEAGGGDGDGSSSESDCPNPF